EDQWTTRRPAAAKEFGAVSFVACETHTFAIAVKKVGKIHCLFIRRTRAAAEEQDAFLLEEFAFDKKFVVSRVTQVSGLFVQDDLCVTGERQNARVPPVIREIHPAYFQIVMGRHTHNS